VSALLIVGAGGHGRVVADAALESRRWDRAAFLDKAFPRGGASLGIPIVAYPAQLQSLVASFPSAVVAIGDARLRLELIEECRRAGFELACIVHSSAVVTRFATLGAGVVVMAQAAVNAGSELGAGCIVNTGATVDHDCRLSEGVHICPGAHLAGGVRVGASTWIGIGSVVREGVSIGANVTVGAGAVVVHDIPDGAVAVGIPARPRISQ
jgi:sugar O-acyltransferase (sialic acid O-acetyltransferase NeuD family)